MAPATGFEPVALRLTAECSTAELRRNTKIIVPLTEAIRQVQVHWFKLYE